MLGYLFSGLLTYLIVYLVLGITPTIFSVSLFLGIGIILQIMGIIK